MSASSGEAIVVRVVDYGEADRIATLLSRSQGRVSALARGARRSHRRYPGLTLFACGEARLRPGRGELWGLEGFDVARGFPHLASDVARLAQAAYACELARELVAPHHAEPAAYDLLRMLLGLLDAGEADGALGPAHLRAYELALLDVLGLGPVLDRCVACSDPLAGGAAGATTEQERDDAGRQLDVRRGGVVCAACAAVGAPGVRPFADPARALLLAVRGCGLPGAASLLAVASPRAAWDGAREALQALLLDQVGHPLRSVEFIAKMNSAAARGSGP